MDLRRKRLFLSLLCSLALALVVFQTSPTYADEQDPIEIIIQVSPATLNIQNQGEVVTVHTDIAYSLVLGATVSLNNIPIAWWKSDNQGNFVAKFLIEEVKELVSKLNLDLPQEITLTLSGITTYGENFIGAETITAIDVTPSGTGRK